MFFFTRLHSSSTTTCSSYVGRSTVKSKKERWVRYSYSLKSPMMLRLPYLEYRFMGAASPKERRSGRNFLRGARASFGHYSHSRSSY